MGRWFVGKGPRCCGVCGYGPSAGSETSVRRVCRNLLAIIAVPCLLVSLGLLVASTIPAATASGNAHYFVRMGLVGLATWTFLVVVRFLSRPR